MIEQGQITMNPLHLGSPSLQSYAPPANNGESIAPVSLETQSPHPTALKYDRLSGQARSFLGSTDAQPEYIHQVMLLLAYNSICEGLTGQKSEHGDHVHYGNWVTIRPENDVGYLTVRTTLNKKNLRYDIVGIDLEVPSSLEIPSSSKISSLEAPVAPPQEQAALSRPAQAPLPTNLSLFRPKVLMPGEPRFVRYEPPSGPVPKITGRNTDRVPDKNNPGRTISKGTLRSQELLLDQLTGEILSRSAVRDRQKVKSTLTGEVKSKSAARMEKSRATKKAKQAKQAEQEKNTLEQGNANPTL